MLSGTMSLINFAVMGKKMTIDDVERMLAGAPGIAEETVRFVTAAAGRLIDGGVLDDTDEGGLRMLMLAYDMYIKASRELLRDGPLLRDKRGRMSVHPAEKLCKTYYAQVLAFMREYGLTVRAKERIKSLAPDEDEQSPLSRFIMGMDG